MFLIVPVKFKWYTTIINGRDYFENKDEGEYNVIKIYADFVNVTGFTIDGDRPVIYSGSGINIINSEGCMIKKSGGVKL